VGKVQFKADGTLQFKALICKFNCVKIKLDFRPTGTTKENYNALPTPAVNEREQLHVWSMSTRREVHLIDWMNI
jgi:hypothetical protein